VGIDRTGPIGQYRFAGSNPDRARQAGRSDAAPAGGSEDSINLSSAARDLAAAPPEERAEMVRRIRSQVDAGAYRLDADSIARHMVDRGDL
jgi:flagellar biosynthesis anti-sigma factor FlgM